MKWKFSIPKTVTLVYYFVKLIGLAPFTLKNEEIHPPTLLGKVYPVCVAVGCSLLTSTTFTPLTEVIDAVDSSRFVKIWFIILHFMGLTSTLGTLVIFFSKPKKIVYLMNKLCTISNDLKSLSIEEDREKFFKNLFVITVTANVTIVASWMVVHLMNPYIPIAIRIKDFFDSWFGLNMVLIFAQILFCIKQRFTLVIEKLNDLLIPIRSLRSPRNPRVFVMSPYFQRLRMIEILHMELSDLLRQTTQLFIFPILLNSLRFFIELVLNLYWIYISSLHTTPFDFLGVLCCVLQMLLVSVQLFIIAHASETICEQGNYVTKAVLFDVWNKLTRAEPTDAGVYCMFTKFSYQLLHTTLDVSASGLMDLGYSFVYKIFGTVITYSIIVIQFHESRTSA